VVIGAGKGAVPAGGAAGGGGLKIWWGRDRVSGTVVKPVAAYDGAVRTIRVLEARPFRCPKGRVGRHPAALFDTVLRAWTQG